MSAGEEKPSSCVNCCTRAVLHMNENRRVTQLRSWFAKGLWQPWQTGGNSASASGPSSPNVAHAPAPVDVSSSAVASGAETGNGPADIMPSSITSQAAAPTPESALSAAYAGNLAQVSILAPLCGEGGGWHACRNVCASRFSLKDLNKPALCMTASCVNTLSSAMYLPLPPLQPPWLYELCLAG